MITDLGDVGSGREVRPDVAIIGAGAAGITLARALTSSSLSVVLLESGGLEPDDGTAALAQMDDVGLPYSIKDSRLRYFGGTTNHWAGYCNQLDAEDFESNVAFERWPITKADLTDYYAQAQRVVEIGDAPWDLDWARQNIEGFEPFFDDDTWTTILWRFSPPTRFGTRYRADLENAPADRLTVYLHANVVNIATTPDGRAVTGLDVASLDGTTMTVRPGITVLATGGLEVPRVLLASNKVRPEGVANSSGLVGACFMEHPHVLASGAWVLPEGHEVHDVYIDGLTRDVKVDGVAVLAGTRLTPQARIERKLRGCALTLFPSFDGMPAQPLLDGARRLVAGRDRPARPYITMTVRSEQGPNPRSRVRLTNERDALGMPKAALDWELTKADSDSFVATLDAFAREVARRGLGRVRLPTEDILDIGDQLVGGWHHMGTTRMHEDPASGVVDANLRAHDVDNLYIAGSSVFTTAGVANPTLNIVALTLRLADHLRDVAKGGA
jgi:choline dehydrogenase-like flavoprotein